jgi:hypothetical protein
VGHDPVEIDDEEHEQVLERVAAIDVAKKNGMVCTRLPHPSKPGRRVSKVWEVAATTNSIVELSDHLVCQGIERIVAGEHRRLLASVLVSAGGAWPDGVAGGRRSGEERARSSQERHPRRDLAGQAE